MPNKIDWAYVAGFFDGEGCISWTGPLMRPLIFVVQSDLIGYITLCDIQEFLREHRITATLHKGSNRPPRRPNWRLQAASVPNIIGWLQGMLPHLRIKRLLAQDSIRALTIFPKMEKGSVASRITRSKR